VMAGIKPLEIRSHRDSMVTILLAYFLTITSLFVFENLSMTLYLFVSVWVTTGVLIHVNAPDGHIRRQMRLAARLVLTAIPLMALLFLLFPRVSGSFWGSPWARQGRSGFANTMRIGDISRLVMVDAPAFTVSFDGRPPQADLLYWRGIVFQRFDGRTWHPARRTTARRNRVRGMALSSYAVILEPHGHRHLFALDLPSTVTPVAVIQADHTVLARRTVRQRFHYGASSILEYRQTTVQAPGPDSLQLPLNRNPRTIALGRQWAQAIDAPGELVERALGYFRDNGFTYTLQPDRLGADAVDDFLLTSRKGFCEHFATAFGVLMRAAGVPTRLVGGYQGGKWNPVGEFLTVRHSDAHVWCEVWLADQGWVRIDPTVEVAPDRIDAGIENAIRQEGLPGFLRRSGKGLARWRDTISQTWEAINIRWDLWFMGFSAEDQMAMLARLGLSLGRRGGWLLLLIVPPAFIAATILIRRLLVSRRRRPPADAALTYYHRFLTKMNRIGLPKAPHQGALDYARLIGRRHPRLRPDVDVITQRYIGLRYGHDGGSQALKALALAVRRFRPKRDDGRRRTDDGSRRIHES